MDGERPTNRTRAAIEAASRRWREAAVHIKGELRAHGVRGKIRPLDDFASGHRGAAAVKQLHTLVYQAYSGGLPADVIAADLSVLALGIVADVYGQQLGPAA